MSSLGNLLSGLKSFPGGIHPPDSKELSKSAQVQPFLPPALVRVLMAQHIGAPAKPVVKKKDAVKRGQVVGEAAGFVSACVHSPISGIVKDVEDFPSPVTGRPVASVVIESDGEDAWAEGVNVRQDPMSVEPKRVVELVQKAGVVGMGGATFPTHVKLSPPPNAKIEHVIINGVECEPYLTSDYRLMLDQPDRIVTALRLIMKTVGAPRGHIGVEANKPDAFQALSLAAKGSSDVQVHLLQVKYPQGAEHMLIKALEGREIPWKGGLPSAVGCLVHNAATAIAILDAVEFQRPLIERLVCVTGEGVKIPANLSVRIGTPISAILEQQGLHDGANKVLFGGPMMGLAQASLDTPTMKGVNGILVLRNAARWQRRPCIRCGRCVDACPYRLIPSELSILGEREDWDAAAVANIMECKECGCCTYVCPSKRPIVQLVKFGKSELARKRRAQEKPKK
ncbi:MAG TPA: electron transport complex subunit RsxC [Candidatus Brocadiia bacterium]|nr:electron transport complex subunit RsxC [Candidatus Brocadiia bacterium]